jgi:hypothetical protein
MAGYGDTVYGLNQIKIVPATGSAVDLLAAQELEYEEDTENAELKGNDQIVASRTFMKAIKWKMKGGGLSLEAYSALTGRTPVTSGTGPTEVITVTLRGGDAFPYVKIYGKAIGSTDDLHVKFNKCVLQKINAVQLKNGAFNEFTCEGIAISDGTGVVGTVVQNKTATTLPTT